MNVQRTLSDMYPDINDVDPYVATFAEDKVDKNSIVGPMQRISIREQFQRIRDGDRFWYENPGVLSSMEQQQLESFTLGSMVRLNTNITYYPDDPFVSISLSSNFFMVGPNSVTTGQTVSNSVNVLGVLTLSWTIRQAAGMIDFQFESNSTGWFGFGFGSSMLGADIYFVTKNTSGIYTVQDSWSSATIPVPSDVSQGGVDNVVNQQDITASQNFSTRVVKFSRLLDTGDPFDIPIASGDMNVIFAYSETNSLTWHGTATVTIAVSRTTISPGLKAIHGASMYLAFGFVYPLGVFMARYSQNMGSWLSIHRSLMTIITSNVLMAALTAIVGSYGDASFLHYRIGLAVVVMICGTLSLGYMSVSFHERISKFGIWAEQNIEHEISGYASYLGGLTAGYFGVCDITAGTKYNSYLPWFYIGSVIVTPLTICLYGEFYSLPRSKVAQITSSDIASLPIFTWDDINQRVASGSKWIIIDSLIYDAQKYLPSHPGGMGSILKMVVMFHGMQEKQEKRKQANYLETDGRNFQSMKKLTIRRTQTPETSTQFEYYSSHRHTRFAKFILAGLAVGKLKVDENDVTENTSLLSATLGRVNGRQREHEWESRQYNLSTERFITVQLEKKILITDLDAKQPVFIFRFSLPQADSEISVKPGQFFIFQHVDESDGKIITRSYWPLHSTSKGGLEFLIKITGGDMTTHLINCSSIRMRGPIPHSDISNVYNESGAWKILGLITEGIGLSGALLVIDYHLRHCRRDKVTNQPQFQIHLLAYFANEVEIFAEKELAQLEGNSNGSIVITTLLKESNTRNYAGLVGSISKEVLNAVMPKPDAVFGLSWNSELKDHRFGLQTENIFNGGIFQPSASNFGNSEGLVRRKHSEKSVSSGDVESIKDIKQFNVLDDIFKRSISVEHSATSEIIDNEVGMIVFGSTETQIIVEDMLLELGYSR
ncbi:hypothetical protein HK100_002371, partial [Physocladia obscura]